MKKKDGMRGFVGKKVLCFLLAVSMTIALSGCNSGVETGGNSGNQTDIGGNEGISGGTGDENAAEVSGNVAMGRYVEEEIDLSEMITSPAEICKREDGSLVILDRIYGPLVSGDQGSTWSMETPDWFKEMQEVNAYVAEIVMTPDGTYGVLYDSYDHDDYTPSMKLVLSDGTQVPVEIPLEDEEDYINRLCASEEGRIIVLTRRGNVFEIQKDGSGELLFSTQSYGNALYCKGNLIYVDISSLSGMPLIYDMDAGKYVEDDVLTDFVSDHYEDREYNGSMDCPMYLLPAEEQVVYVIGAKGVHRHMVGGNMMEQLVDGGLSMLSNPSYRICSAVMLEADTFLVLFAGNKLIRYTYDPNIPAVPEKMLTIYSLYEDETIRQAVSYYQAQNTDVFVSYEVGVAEGSAVTREDAIKKLNTEIMSGTGPDLLVMDDMPLSSYIDKGMLLDITDYLAQCSDADPLFDNIIEAMKVKDRAYVVPATVTIPMLIGAKEYVENMTDLSGIADAVEDLRDMHPGEDIIGICDEMSLLNRFAAVSAPMWLAEDGSLNREVIGEYLEQCGRIYHAQIENIDSGIVEEYTQKEAYYSTYGENRANGLNHRLATDMFEYIQGGTYLLSGFLDEAHNYEVCLSIERVEGFEETAMKAMEGHCSQVFMPQTLLGISAASKQPDEAKEFMKFFLSAEVAAGYYDFPINQAAFDEQFIPNRDYLSEDGVYGSLALVTEDGSFTTFEVYWPADEQIAALKEELASVNTAYIPDPVLEDAVFKEGGMYLRGRQTLEETLEEIEKQVAIYMAE